VLRQAGLRREIALHHLAALGVHLPRIGGAVDQHGQGLIRSQPQGPGKDQPFGQGRPIQSQDEVRDQLHLGAASPRPHVDHLAGDARQQVAAGIEGFGRSADNAGRLPAPGLLAGAGERRVQVVDPSRGQRRSQGGRLFRFARGGIHENLSRPQFPAQLSQDGLHRFGVIKADHHPITLGQRVGGPGGAQRQERLGLIGSAIPNAHLVPGPEQPFADGAAHQPQSENAHAPQIHDPDPRIFFPRPVG